MFAYSSVQAGAKLHDCANNNCYCKDGFTLVFGDNGLSPGNKSLRVALKYVRGVGFQFSIHSKLEASSKKATVNDNNKSCSFIIYIR